MGIPKRTTSSLGRSVSLCSQTAVVWAWMHWLANAVGTRTETWFGHGCSGDLKLLEHEREYGLGMDALVSLCSSDKKGIMV